MKLSQIYIRKYGPFQKDLQLKEGINVVSGPNESGKSLLVEALLKQLAANSVTDPVIQDHPEGFVEVTDGQDSQTIRDEQSLTEFCEEVYNQEITAAELRNIFVVRAGDLQFNSGDEFYSHITDKLTGQRVREIDSIRSELIDAGRLTKGRLNISNKQEFGKVADQLEAAKDLKEDVTSYLETATRENLDQAERDQIKTQRRIASLNDRIEELEIAKEASNRQTRYRRLESRVNELEETLDTLDSLPTESELESVEEKLSSLTDDQARQSELNKRASRSWTLAKWSLGGGVIALLATFAIGFPFGGMVGVLLFVGATAYFWRQSRTASKSVAELDTLQQEVLSGAHALGFESETIDELQRNLVEYQSQRDDLQEQKSVLKGKIESLLDADGDGVSDLLEKAEAEMNRLQESIDDEPDIEYQDGAVTDTQQELEETQTRLKELQEQLQTHQEKLEDFRKRAYQLQFSSFTGHPLELEIESLDSLRDLHTRLTEFIDAIETDAEASRTAIEIFDEIQDEEQERTAELFEEGSRATELFHEITDSRYTTVTYNNDSNKLAVEKDTGETFGPTALSDGTRDQLYFAIRVALGERLLEGYTGFFVLDDAFVTSDKDRLQSQAKIIETLADDGWQIIYLTSKNDAISTLGEQSDNEILELQPLE